MTNTVLKQEQIDQHLARMDAIQLTLSEVQAGTVASVDALTALRVLDDRMRHRVKAALFNIRPDTFKMPAGYERRTPAYGAIVDKSSPSLALLKAAGMQARHVVTELEAHHARFVEELEYQGIPAPVLPSPADLRETLSKGVH